MPVGKYKRGAQSVISVSGLCGRRFAVALVACLPLLMASAASGYVPQNSLGQARICGAVSAADNNGQVLCRDARTTFRSGEDVCMLVHLKETRNHRRYRMIAYRDGKERRRFTSDEGPTWLPKGSDAWAHCERHIAMPGEWRFDVFVDRGRGGFERLSSAHFTVEEEAGYRFVDAATCAFIGAAGADGEVACLGQTDSFMPGEPAHLWVKLSEIATDHRFMVKTYRDDSLIGQRHTYWRKANPKRASSFFVPTEYNTTPGRYRAEFFIDTGNGFRLLGERSFSVDVLSPVQGPLEQKCTWGADPEVWAFCKHRRRRSRGVTAADDTRAWDVNLPRFADTGKPVYPVAPGRVVKYGGDLVPGSGKMAGVLIEHKTPGGARWWSGYLHMRRDSINIRVGQWVDVKTPLGVIGRTGASNNHLHVVIYDGKNVTGGLKSVDVAFRARDTDGSTPVLVAKRRGNRGEMVR